MECKHWHEYIQWHIVDTAKINSKNYYELWVMFCYSFPLEVMSIHTCQCLSLQGSHFTITFAECLWGLRDCRKTLANVYPFLRSCTEIAFGVCIGDQAFRHYTENRKRKKKCNFWYITLNTSLNCEGLFTKLLSSFPFHWLQLLALQVLSLQKEGLLKREYTHYFKSYTAVFLHYLDPFRIRVSVHF